jgi:hypothetical protein
MRFRVVSFGIDLLRAVERLELHPMMSDSIL